MRYHVNVSTKTKAKSQIFFEFALVTVGIIVLKSAFSCLRHSKKET